MGKIDKDKVDGIRGQAQAVMTGGPSLGGGREERVCWGGVGVAETFKKEKRTPKAGIPPPP